MELNVCRDVLFIFICFLSSHSVRLHDSKLESSAKMSFLSLPLTLRLPSSPFLTDRISMLARVRMLMRLSWALNKPVSTFTTRGNPLKQATPKNKQEHIYINIYYIWKKNEHMLHLMYTTLNERQRARPKREQLS